MIQTEIIDGKFIRHYSDDNKYILQNETSVEYDEAVDLIPCQYTYSETDHEKEKIEEAEEIEETVDSDNETEVIQ